jgi:hypothetical protein
MSVYQPPPRVDTTWQGYADYVNDLAKNAPSPLREHFAAECAVIQPTLRVLGMDTGRPPPVVNTAAAAPPVVTRSPVIDPQDTGGKASPASKPPHFENGGGVGNAGISVFSTKAQNGPLTEEEAWRLAVDVARQLIKDFGFTRAQAAGIVGNLFHESAGMNANVNEFGWRFPEGDGRNFGAPFDNPYGYGWAQWSADRKDAFRAFCSANGLDPASPAANYAFLVHELRTTESKTVPAVLATDTASNAAIVFRQVFERAAMPVDGKRTSAADTIYQGLA